MFADGDPVNLLHNTFNVVVPPEREDDTGHRPAVVVNAAAERDSLRSWIANEAWQFAYNRTLYRLDGDFFERVIAAHACSDDCQGIWPTVSMAGEVTFGSEHESWLTDLSPFTNQPAGREPVRTWFPLGRLTDLFDRRLCPEDGDRAGTLSGAQANCPCEFSYDDVVVYLRDQLRHVRGRAESVRPGLFDDMVRGMHLNFEQYAFPVWTYEPTNSTPVRLASPGVCIATGSAFNAADFGDPEFAHNAGTGGGLPSDPILSLEAFLTDVEFDYPALMLETTGTSAGVYEFGKNADRGISQSFVITNEFVSRVDVRLSHQTILDGGGNAVYPQDIYYTLSSTDSVARPDFIEYTTPRARRGNWVPHVDQDGRDWISLYVDPLESRDAFDVGDTVAIVLFPLVNTSYCVDHEPKGSGFAALRVSTGGSLPPSASGSSELGKQLQHRVWYATRTDRSAHEDWVTFQTRRVGQVLADINAAVLFRRGVPCPNLAGGTPVPMPNVELRPFAHIPGGTSRGMSIRELYGSDIGEDFQGNGTATHVDGIQSGFVSSLNQLRRIQIGGVKPATYQITDENAEPNYDPARIHDSSKWSFALGGLSVFHNGFAPRGTTANAVWKEAQYPKLRGWTAPRRLFPDHYRWASAGNLPDSSAQGDIYSLSLSCPLRPGLGSHAGHVLAANDASGERLDENLLAHIPLHWRTAQFVDSTGGAFQRDRVTLYRQALHATPEIPVEEYDLCAPMKIRVDFEGRGDPDLGSLIVARYWTPHDQPGTIDHQHPSGPHCTDETVWVGWTPVPEVCLEQNGFDTTVVAIDYEILGDHDDDTQTPDQWYRLYTPIGFSADDGEEFVELCGGYPPTIKCPTRTYGREWRVRLRISARTTFGGPYYPLYSTVSEPFTVFPEYGDACRTAGGCPWVGVATTEGHVFDNNVLAYSGNGVSVVDHYRLRVEPALLEGAYHLTLTETAEDFSIVDRVGLVLVDHPVGTHVAVAPDGGIFGYGAVRPPLSALDGSGTNVTGLLAAEDDTLHVHGFAGDHVTLELGVADSTSALYVVSDLKHVQEPLSVLVQVPEPTTDWTTIKRLEPRDRWGEDVLTMDALGVSTGDSVRVRLLWTAEHKVDFVGLLSGTAEWTATPLPLGWAHHTRDGEVTEALAEDDLAHVALATGDVVLLEFPADSVATGWVRDVVLVTEGAWTGPGGVPARQASSAGGERPAMRVLGPRPVRGTVSVGFRLPSPARASVRVFDVQGRRVRTLVDGPHRAGAHVATWDLRDERRVALSPGVYFARFAVEGRTVDTEKIHVVR